MIYGTDLGNTRDAVIQSGELALMRAAGMSPRDILASATDGPAALWGFTQLGRLAPGKSANFLLFNVNPARSLESFSDPTAVFQNGNRVR